ncbi:MAG TPA: 16S rRNA (guanine(966)-N(2))-methyltransferase RsmD [Anaerolineales bacterium]
MSGLRVITGKARGRKLKSVPGDTTRPITDRVKESLFDILGADLNEGQGVSFLDLFAGTGAVGIEALSRGAKFVRFVDQNRLAVDTIRFNLDNTGLGSSAEVLRVDAFSMITRQPDRTFDYIYIAPPQYKDLWKKALFALEANPGWLSPDAWVIVQIHPVEEEPLELKLLSEFDRRRYGSTLLIFYRVEG